jgi:hypothetical protein
VLCLTVRGPDLPIWLAKQAADIEGTSDVGQIGSDGSHLRSCTATQHAQGSASAAVAARPNLCQRETPPIEDAQISKIDDSRIAIAMIEIVEFKHSSHVVRSCLA